MKSVLPKSLLNVKSPPRISKSKSGKPSLGVNKFKEMQLNTEPSKFAREQSTKLSSTKVIIDKSSNDNISTDDTSNQHQIKVIVRFRPYIELEKVTIVKTEKGR